MLPRELRRCTLRAGLILNTVTGVIIHCKALWVVSHTRKALYKNQLLSLLYFSLQAIILQVFYMNKPVNLYWRWWRMETVWSSIQWVPIKRKPERAVSSPLKWNIISIITNFNSSSFIWHPKLSWLANAWPSKNNVKFQCQNQYVQRTAQCSNGLAKGWFISISISFCACVIMHVSPNLSLRMAACFKIKKERQNNKERQKDRKKEMKKERERKNERGGGEQPKKAGKK